MNLPWVLRLNRISYWTRTTADGFQNSPSREDVVNSFGESVAVLWDQHQAALKAFRDAAYEVAGEE